MPLWYLWFGLAIVCAILEMALPYFGLIFVSGAAFVALIISMFWPSWAVEGVAFAITLALGLLLLRPRLVRKLQTSQPNLPSRTEALIGQQAVVSEAIDPSRGVGRVEVGGHDWAATAEHPISQSRVVEVVGADGIVLKVKEVE